MARGTSGYSGTPLVKKLGLKTGMRAATIGAPENYSELIENFAVREYPIPSRVAGEWAFLQLFCRDERALQRGLPRMEKHLSQGGMIWVSWPKKSSELWKDLTEDGVRTAAFPLGLVDVKVCAVDADWSGLKLMRRTKSKKP